MNNEYKAEQLHQAADDIETTKAAEAAERSSQMALFQPCGAIDASREDLAVISVSQAIANIGVIESANPAALTMFGYNRRDMLGKNISLIVPFPLSTMHDKYLMNYIATGHSVRAMPVARLYAASSCELVPLCARHWRGRCS